MPFTIIPFLLLAVPIVEIAVFIAVGREIGLWATLGLILLTAVLGSILLRVQGFAVVEKIRREVEAGRLPGRQLGDGAMILVAGVLLLTPGFVTDSIGFALFVPALRDWIWRGVASRFVVTGLSGRRSGQQAPLDPDDDRIVDLEPHEFKEKNRPQSPWRKPRN